MGFIGGGFIVVPAVRARGAGRFPRVGVAVCDELRTHVGAVVGGLDVAQEPAVSVLVVRAGVSDELDLGALREQLLELLGRFVSPALRRLALVCDLGGVDAEHANPLRLSSPAPGDVDRVSVDHSVGTDARVGVPRGSPRPVTETQVTVPTGLDPARCAVTVRQAGRAVHEEASSEETVPVCWFASTSALGGEGFSRWR